MLAAAAIGASALDVRGLRQARATTSPGCAIDGLITGDRPTLEMLEKIAESDTVKAVIVASTARAAPLPVRKRSTRRSARSPAKKPVVAVMDTVAASGGYITAIAADHIVARGNTITGSIGVIFQWAGVSRLLETLGVRWRKSSRATSRPSPRPTSR